MSKESTEWKRTQKVTCPNSETGGHCWHFAGHQHPSFDRCCFCKMSGEQIFGAGYTQKISQAPATTTGLVKKK